MSLDSPQTETFHPFPRLPAELRLLIWQEVLSQPHLVQVFVHDFFNGRLPHASAKRGRKYRPGIAIRYPIFRSHGKRLPTLFCVNKETRELASKSYDICLSTVINPATRFRLIRLVTNHNYLHVPPGRSEVFLQRLESLKTYLLPSTRNTNRIQRKHAKYTGKGIYFRPNIDTIYFRHVYNTPAWNTCMYNLPASDLKTENIKRIAIDWSLCTSVGTTFSALFVPHITSYRSLARPSNEKQMMPNVTDFTIMTHWADRVYDPPRAYIYEIFKAGGKPKVVERLGSCGNLTVAVVEQRNYEGWTPQGSICVDTLPKLKTEGVRRTLGRWFL